MAAEGERSPDLEKGGVNIPSTEPDPARVVVVALALTIGCKPKEPEPTPEELTNELTRATRAGDVEATAAALRRGADPNRRDGAELTPLGLASCFGYVDVVKILLEAGADPTLKFVSSKNAYQVLWMEPWTCTTVGEKQFHPERAEGYQQLRDLLEQQGAKDPLNR